MTNPDKHPRIKTLPETHFIGMRHTMTYAANTTPQLWQSFSPRRADLPVLGNERYSIEVYPPGFFEPMDVNRSFEKWAAVAAPTDTPVPEGMEEMTSPEGLYAVFTHYGPPSLGPQTYQYIYGVWIPESQYTLDDRPHFAIMDERYKHNAPDSEEEIWVPIK